MKRKYGADARPAKVPAGVKNYSKKAHLVVAPTYARGLFFADQMGWKDDRVAVITEADYLTGIQIDPGEDIYVMRDTDNVVICEALKNLSAASTQLKRGEHFNLKIII